MVVETDFSIGMEDASYIWRNSLAIPENRGKQKIEIQFFSVKDKHCGQVLTFLLSPIESQPFYQNWSTCYYFLYISFFFNSLFFGIAELLHCKLLHRWVTQERNESFFSKTAPSFVKSVALFKQRREVKYLWKAALICLGLSVIDRSTASHYDSSVDLGFCVFQPRDSDLLLTRKIIISWRKENGFVVNFCCEHFTSLCFA